MPARAHAHTAFEPQAQPRPCVPSAHLRASPRTSPPDQGHVQRLCGLLQCARRPHQAAAVYELDGQRRRHCSVVTSHQSRGGCDGRILCKQQRERARRRRTHRLGVGVNRAAETPKFLRLSLLGIGGRPEGGQRRVHPKWRERRCAQVYVQGGGRRAIQPSPPLRLGRALLVYCRERRAARPWPTRQGGDWRCRAEVLLLFALECRDAPSRDALGARQGRRAAWAVPDAHLAHARTADLGACAAHDL